MEKEETAKCSVCYKLFERSIDPERRYISCPAHSFGETVDQEREFHLEVCEHVASGFPCPKYPDVIKK